MFLKIPQPNQEKEELFYILTKAKYELRNDLNLYEKRWLSLLLSKFLKKKTQKNMIIGYVSKHPKYEVSDFTNNFMTPLLDKLSNENKDIMIYLEHE